MQVITYRLCSAVATVLLLAAFATSLRADTIPYPNIGTVAPTSAFTASVTGEIAAYFYGSSAGGTDFINVVDVTQNISTGWIFDNHNTAIGTMQTLSGVQAGDSIEFWIQNQAMPNQGILSSNPADSADHTNHAYSTPYSATGPTAVAGIPAGTYVGMEDEAVPGSDLDYNDDAFVFTNVGPAVSSVPEPSSVILLSAGLSILLFGKIKFRRAQN